MNASFVVLPGDGIGPEVTAEAVRALEAVASRCGHAFSFTERLMGGCSIDAHGTALTDEVLAECRAADAVLLGAVGGPKWDDPRAKVRPEQGLLALRKGLGVFANLRPVKVHPSLVDASPIKPERVAGVDILVIRELTGGLYFGQPKGRETKDGVRARRRHARVPRLRDPARHGAGLPHGEGTALAGSPRSTRRTCSSRRGCGAQIATDSRPRPPGGRARPHAGRHGGDAADHEPGDARRGRHREHVRRHPHGRGLGARGLDGHAAFGVDRRLRARGSTSRSTAPPPISPAGASRTRSARSCPPRWRCGTRSGSRPRRA